MAKSPDALVEPALLVWARESARTSIAEAARRLKIEEERIEAWEIGLERPTVSQLRKLSDIYRRPIAVFFLPEPPRDFDALRDFRRVSGQESPQLSKKLLLELRRTQELREAALTLLDEAETGMDFPFSATLNDNAEHLAAAIRGTLNVTTEEQQHWKDPHSALREWRSAVEGLGIMVVNMRGIEVSEARGFSIASFPLPLIALNSKDSANGRVFTLMHELVHLALHESGICEWSRERRLEAESRRIEVFCNQVAAAILMPANLVITILHRDEIPPLDQWRDDIIRRHARTLSVSEEALLRRLVTLGFATQEFYAKKRQEYLKLYSEAAARETKPIVSYERRMVGTLGVAYLSLAFGAYYSRRLSLSELASYTGVRVNNLAKVEREAFGITRVPGAER